MIYSPLLAEVGMQLTNLPQDGTVTSALMATHVVLGCCLSCLLKAFHYFWFHRKIMDSGELDFYRHTKVCSNTCRSTKIDLVGTKVSINSDQSAELVPATPSSAECKFPHFVLLGFFLIPVLQDTSLTLSFWFYLHRYVSWYMVTNHKSSVM